MDMRAGGLSFGNNKPTINEKISSDLEHGERRKTAYRELKKEGMVSDKNNYGMFLRFQCLN
jgi:DNA-binding transcriptional regulator YhcF (GntR family)